MCLYLYTCIQLCGSFQCVCVHVCVFVCGYRCMSVWGYVCVYMCNMNYNR